MNGETQLPRSGSTLRFARGQIWRNLLLVALLGLLVLSGYALYQRYTGHAEARESLSQAEQERHSQEEAFRALQIRAEGAESPFQMEQIARNQLGMVRPWETVFRLSPELLSSSTPSEPAASIPQQQGILGWLERTWQVVADFFRSLLR
ncbi:MAG: septum formation initiator family protein [Coprothermobacterota bacterium]|nr:septum formation initiator family protein [Coprothermobacterota bacterium]